MAPFNHLCILIGGSVLLSEVSALPSQPEPSPQSITSNLALPIGLSNQFNRSISPEFSTSTNLSASSLATQSVHCNGTQYRSNLRADSCMNALSQIPRDPRKIRFSQRGFGHYEVALPARWISCKCSCCSSSPVFCAVYLELIGY